jgi:hypothetical protein
MGNNPGILFDLPFAPSQVMIRGYREKSHRCLKYAIEALIIDEGLLDASVLDHFSYAIGGKVLITVASIIPNLQEWSSPPPGPFLR